MAHHEHQKKTIEQFNKYFTLAIFNVTNFETFLYFESKHKYMYTYTSSFKIQQGIVCEQE